MIVMTVGENETIVSSKSIQIDMFENDLTKRSCGRLASNRPDKLIGFFAMNFDGKRIFEPLGMACDFNPKCNQKTLDNIYAYYENNYRAFFKIPRYSDNDINAWEKRIKDNPKALTPWNFFRDSFKNKKTLSIDPQAVAVDGIIHIAHHLITDNGEYFFNSSI